MALTVPTVGPGLSLASFVLTARTLRLCSQSCQGSQVRGVVCRGHGWEIRSCTVSRVSWFGPWMSISSGETGWSEVMDEGSAGWCTQRFRMMDWSVELMVDVSRHRGFHGQSPDNPWFPLSRAPVSMVCRAYARVHLCMHGRTRSIPAHMGVYMCERRSCT